MTEIYKPKKEIRKDFILAVVFGVLLLSHFYFGSTVFSKIIGLVLVSSYSVNAYVFKNNPYLKLDDEKIISINIFNKKEIFWENAVSIKYFAAEWSICSDKHKIIVSKDILNAEEWNVVNKIIEAKSKLIRI